MHPGGKFAGVGSRDYRRPDERIIGDIHVRLMQHGLIDASDIEVTVRYGAVLLSGTTPNRQMKELAENVARSVWGVKDVQNEIRALYQRAA